MRTYKIYTKRIANQLCRRRFRMVGTDINDQKPWLTMYLFEDTPDLRKALEEIKLEYSSSQEGQDGK